MRRGLTLFLERYNSGKNILYTKMSAVQDHQMFDFGVLRELRKREDLTIEDVSSRSGVSAAVISKLERNQTRAELETLFRLSRVFGLNAADLLNLAESQTSHRTHSDDYESGAFQFRRIVYANFTCFHGKAKKGATVSRPEIHQDDNELCWVLEGSVRIRLPHEQHELGAGEAIQFDAILEHTYQATRDCVLIIAHLPKPKRF